MLTCQKEIQIVWEIQWCSPPKIFRHCKKCKKKVEYISSGQFRINAQRKSLDIWLIYKCSNCNTTWNSTIYSRIPPQYISAALLERFHANDETLAMQYSMNISLLKQNGAEVEMSDYQILGEAVTFAEQVNLKINNPYSLPLRVSSILRKKLDISHRELDELLIRKRIYSQPEQDLQKCKLFQTITLSILNSGSSIKRRQN